MHYRVTHDTTYEYTEPVSLCQNMAHLTPRDGPGQTCLESSLAIHPVPAVVVERVDYFGNPSTFFAVQEPHRELKLTAVHRVEVVPRTPPDPVQTPPWEQVRDLLSIERSREVLDASPFVCYAH